MALFLFAAIVSKQASAQQGYVNYQVFYDQLSPYGQWVDYEDYGYVWLPDAGSGFVPYSTGGQWIYTEYGWTWASDYDWGWAPFHYGRWDYDNYYGWMWIPDTEWGPAWVTWRRAEGYYGWAPMQPGISINASFGRDYNRNHDHWMFVRDRDIERSNINRYYVDRTVHNRIVVNSTVINTTYIDNSRHTTYVSGPARNDVQRATGRQVSTVVIHENTKPGRDVKNGRMGMYRPQVQKNDRNDHKVAPSRIENIKDVKKPSERNAASQPRYTKPSENSNKQNQQRDQQNQQNQQQQNQQRDQQNQQQQQQKQEMQKQQQRQQPQQQPKQNANPSQDKKQQPARERPSKNKKPPKETDPNRTNIQAD